VADNDAAVGRVVEFLSHSPIWKSTAIIISQDDAQGSPDHVYAHRTYTMVVSPWAKRQAVVHTLGSTVSIPKTIEEILNLPAMSYGDLLANDLLDYFTTTPDYTPFTAVPLARASAARVPAEVARVWSLASRLDSSTYDVQTAQLGGLTRYYFQSLKLSKAKGSMSGKAYAAKQASIYAAAKRLVG
jgi:hypothetical protein